MRLRLCWCELFELEQWAALTRNVIRPIAPPSVIGNGGSVELCDYLGPLGAEDEIPARKFSGAFVHLADGGLEAIGAAEPERVFLGVAGEDFVLKNFMRRGDGARFRGKPIRKVRASLTRNLLLPHKRLECRHHRRSCQ